MESITRTLSASFIDIYDENLLDYIELSLSSFKNIQIDSLIENINLLKIKFQIMLFLTKDTSNSIIINNIDTIIKNNTHCINLLLAGFNEDENIQESKYFKKIIKNI
tara:strand:+ start:95 stop:415 length:321 start_codon:yes stop_codon:yes gene_type:complete